MRKAIFLSHRRVSPVSRGIFTHARVWLALLSPRKNGDYSYSSVSVILTREAQGRGDGREASLSFSSSPSWRCRVTFPRPIRDRVEIIRQSDTVPRSAESFLRLLILHFALSLCFTLSLQSVFYTQSSFYLWSAVCVLYRPVKQHFLKVPTVLRPTPTNNKRLGHFPLSPRNRRICIVYRFSSPIGMNQLIFIDYINYIDWFHIYKRPTLKVFITL